MKNKGKNQHRLSQNPLEEKFAKEWEKRNTLSRHGMLEYILAGENNTPAFVEDHDREVAASVIQWLGTPVGQGFLTDVLKNSIKPNPTGRGHIIHENQR